MPKSEKVTFVEALSLIVSVIALLVSGLTWMDVGRQLKLYGGQVRAHVQVVEASLVEPLSEASLIGMTLHLRNVGQTTARDIRATFHYALGMPSRRAGASPSIPERVAPMGPGLERALTIRANTYNRRSWPRPGPRGESVYLFGTVWYVDETTKEEWYEDWCFRVPLRTPGDLKRTNVEECGILTYDSSKDPSR